MQRGHLDKQNIWFDCEYREVYVGGDIFLVPRDEPNFRSQKKRKTCTHELCCKLQNNLDRCADTALFVFRRGIHCRTRYIVNNIATLDKFLVHQMFLSIHNG